jgi:signal transduction histidine kinase
MHEMNTPLGALLSGIDTLVLTTSKYSGASEDERRRLDAVQADVSGSLRNSAARLQQLIARVRRFSILDDTTREDADVNALIEDAIALTGVTDGERATLRLQLQPLPEISCRPRQLATAFASLLSNAFHAVNGDGQVAVATRRGAAGMEIEITDNGRGIPPGQLAHIFDPAFQTSHGRMASGNWSMFNSRQIVREHGGDILITSSEGVGTRVTVTLPLPESEVAE